MSSRANAKDTAFLKMTQVLGELGTCDRAYVGALIVKEGRCISWGYNGAPPGLPHCNKNHHGHQAYWNQWAHISESNARVAVHNALQELGCQNATHAEANAIAFAARQGISCEGATLYVGISPCATCARLLIAAGISQVVALAPYRDASGVELLKEAGVAVS